MINIVVYKIDDDDNNFSPFYWHTNCFLLKDFYDTLNNFVTDRPVRFTFYNKYDNCSTNYEYIKSFKANEKIEILDWLHENLDIVQAYTFNYYPIVTKFKFTDYNNNYSSGSDICLYDPEDFDSWAREIEYVVKTHKDMRVINLGLHNLLNSTLVHANDSFSEILYQFNDDDCLFENETISEQLYKLKDKIIYYLENGSNIMEVV